MSPKTTVEGIHQTGGRIQAEVIAVGRGAKAQKIVQEARADLEDRGLADVADRLDALLEALKADGDKMPAPDEVEGATAQVAAELKQEQPNKLTLNALLSGIAEGAKSVASIANAATALKVAIAALL